MTRCPAKLVIEHLEDYYRCEQCGGAGAEGARITLDGELLIELIPVADCFGGTSFTEKDILQAVLQKLGHDIEVEEHYG